MTGWRALCTQCGRCRKYGHGGYSHNVISELNAYPHSYHQDSTLIDSYLYQDSTLINCYHCKYQDSTLFNILNNTNKQPTGQLQR